MGKIIEFLFEPEKTNLNTVYDIQKFLTDLIVKIDSVKIYAKEYFDETGKEAKIRLSHQINTDVWVIETEVSLMARNCDSLRDELRQEEIRRLKEILNRASKLIKYFKGQEGEENTLSCLSDIYDIFNQYIKALETSSDSPELIDYSDNTFAERIVFLKVLGIIDFLRDNQKFNISNNRLGQLISTFTGIPNTTAQSYLNPIISKRVSQKNNPLKESSKKMVLEKLNQMDIM